MTTGMGQGRGAIRSYQLPMPPSTGEILLLLRDELAAPGLHSMHVEDGRPIQVTRYVDPDDILDSRITPQELIRQIDRLEEIDLSGISGPHAFLALMFLIQKQRMQCSGMVVGSLESFGNWLLLPADAGLSMRPLSKDHDFYYLGIKGYVDRSLDADRIVLLAGDSDAPTLAGVQLLLATRMEIEKGEPDAIEPTRQ